MRTCTWSCANTHAHAHGPAHMLMCTLLPTSRRPDGVCLSARSVLEQELAASGIPYTVVRSKGLMQHAEVQDMLAYLR